MKEICVRIAEMDSKAIFYPTYQSGRHRPNPIEDIKTFNWNDGTSYLRFFGREEVTKQGEVKAINFLIKVKTIVGSHI